ANPDYIFMPLYPVSGAQFIKQAKELGIITPILGGDALEADEILKSPFSEGLQIVTAKANNPESFKEKVIKATGKESTFLVPLAYDAVMVLANAMNTAKSNDKELVKQALIKTKYRGVSNNNIAFDSQGDLTSAVYEIKVVHNGKVEVQSQ
ncbi:MAG: ABC transporter substrate-binding protein, partial [Candidatus Woesearchaeota archaeon]|nr:ABC transporter substrate-binding protein [Candidatus Woesearchaeota archaeon]